MATFYTDQNEQKGRGATIGVSPLAAPGLTQLRTLGEEVFIGDRKFRYISTGVDIEAGELAGQATGTVIMANAILATAVGETDVTVDDAALSGTAINDFAGGYLHITDDAAQGFSYRIKSNLAAATNLVVVTLYDAIRVALTTASDSQMQPTKYADCVLGTAALNPIGVATNQFTAGTDSSTQFGWVQTAGYGVVRVHNATTLGIGIPVGSGAAGGVVVQTAIISHVGVCTSAAEDANAMQPVELQIEQL